MFEFAWPWVFALAPLPWLLRLVLPAYGAYTGGLNARDAALAAIFSGPYDALAIGASSVHRLPVEALRRDAELMPAK